MFCFSCQTITGYEPDLEEIRWRDRITQGGAKIIFVEGGNGNRYLNS